MSQWNEDTRARLAGLAAFYDTYCSGLASPIQRVQDKARSRKNNANAIRAALARIKELEHLLETRVANSRQEAAEARLDRLRSVVAAADICVTDSAELERAVAGLTPEDRAWAAGEDK